LTADKARVAKTATFAKTAGNATELSGKSVADMAAIPGPASSAAGLVSNKQIRLTVAKTSIGSATATSAGASTPSAAATCPRARASQL
jgi:hypothetical protein